MKRPECYGESFFVPGQGECSEDCRFAKVCKDAYLARARAQFERDASELAEAERAWLEAQAPRPRIRTVTMADRRKRFAEFKTGGISPVAASALREVGKPVHIREILPKVLERMEALGKPVKSTTPEQSVGLALRLVEEVRSLGAGRYVWQAGEEESTP